MTQLSSFLIPQAYAGDAADILSSNNVDPLALKFTSLADVVNALLPSLLTIAGLILFAMIIWGGFEILTSGTDAKKADAGKSRITTGVVGFIIVFSAYWIVQILEVMLGVKILNP